MLAADKGPLLRTPLQDDALADLGAEAALEHVTCARALSPPTSTPPAVIPFAIMSDRDES